MRTSRLSWSLAGVVAGYAGLATSYFAAMVLTTRDAPVAAVAELAVRLTPGAVVERGIQVLGQRDKPFLYAVILLACTGLFAGAGLLARRWSWAATTVFAALAVVGGWAVLDQRNASGSDLLPLALGLATWVGCFWLLTRPLADRAIDAGPALPADHTRRAFLIRAGVVVAGSVALGAVGHTIGRGSRKVEQARRLLRLPGVTAPRLPRGVRVAVDGIAPWATSARDFYRIDTAFAVPTIEPRNWQVRIHGMVDNEVVLTYQQLINRPVTEGWITLNCVSNPVGGPLIGNAWWSGVRLADLLVEAGPHPDANAVLQTSADGWTCGTPLSALTDDRDAMLAVAMNGRPLPIDHGFPVRTIVPGLYGYVSACKWVVDLEVTRFDDISAYWTDRGWSERGPVKIASRIDVPDDGGEIRAGGGRVGGVAWAQHTGISAVEISVDDGPWAATELGRVPSADTWVQWAATLDVEPGKHTLAVRAIDASGVAQTGVVQQPVPDGATGWQRIEFDAKESADG